MRILIVHTEARYFRGTEIILANFLAGLETGGHEVSVAAGAGSQMEAALPEPIRIIPVPDTGRFSPLNLFHQLRSIRRDHRASAFDVIHGWAARDWELTALVGKLLRRPALGTLHDHPASDYISKGRRRLMRWSARWGLERVVGVSEAVAQACRENGYDPGRTLFIHNGLTLEGEFKPRTLSQSPLRIGFLGTLAPSKGLDGVFSMMSRLQGRGLADWELWLAGDTIDEAGNQWVEGLKREYEEATWWDRVRWFGWVKHPREFLAELDLLIFPSRIFDSFPTVLLEAGWAGVPVVAARVGGAPEIVVDGETGWLFESGAWQEAADCLAQGMGRPERLPWMGAAARRRMENCFAVDKMVANYLKLYSTMVRHV